MRSEPWRARAGAVVGAMFGLAACRPAPQPTVLRVAAAASLRELINDGEGDWLRRGGTARLVVSFDASSTLARQIQAGAGFDVFLSADQVTVTRVAGDLVPGTQRVFLRNRLVVVGAADLSVLPRSAADLPDLSGKLALAGPAVPAGRYAREWLEATGVLARLEAKIVSADNVRGALAMVESGAAAAAVVYATDARVAHRARVLFAVPADDDPGVVYVAAAVRGGREHVAADFLQWLGSAGFRALAEQHGFLSPE